MPVFPPQSPARVGDEPAAVPAIVMSLKSQSVADSVLTVNVRVVPNVLDCKKMRLTADAPATVNVPLMVWFPEKLQPTKPAEDAAVIKRLLNVAEPENDFVELVVAVVDTL